MRSSSETVNESLRSMRPKIVFTGSVGAGKTTALKTVSDIPPVTTDASMTEEELMTGGKNQTTVALDYGYLLLANGVKIDLYATPGQERFSFMWEILAKNCVGLIMLLDISVEDPLKDLKYYLEAFEKITGGAPMVVGFTKKDLAADDVMPHLVKYLKSLNPPLSALPTDARNLNQVKMLIMSLLLKVNPGLLK